MNHMKPYSGKGKIVLRNWNKADAARGAKLSPNYWSSFGSGRLVSLQTLLRLSENILNAPIGNKAKQILARKLL